MGFQQGLSGLNVSAKNLDVIGNNVANSNTVGFKSSRTEFADIFASTIVGVAGTQSGIGAYVSKVAQQFTQGNITSSPTRWILPSTTMAFSVWSREPVLFPTAAMASSSWKNPALS